MKEGDGCGLPVVSRLAKDARGGDPLQKGSGVDISANEEEQRSRWEGGCSGGGGGGGALMHAHLSLGLSSGPNNIQHLHAAAESDGTGH